VITPDHAAHAHAMVLGILMGEGDPEFTKRVANPIKSENVMYAGHYDMSPVEWQIVERLGLRLATPSQLVDDSKPVLDWLRSTEAKDVTIHFDLDVISTSQCPI
jgi:arginase